MSSADEQDTISAATSAKPALLQANPDESTNTKPTATFTASTPGKSALLENTQPPEDEKKPSGSRVPKKRSPLSKLATHEDPYHLHKTLGILSLVSFFYRYLYVLPTTGTLGFEGSAFDWANVALHLALSSSSLIFHVISHRKLKFPMLMWNEYRLHAIVFTLRCFDVFALGCAVRHFGWLSDLADTSIFGRFAFFAVVMSHHVLADAITGWYGTPGITSVRVVKSRSTGKVKFAGVKMFYSFYQFLAIGSHLLPHARTTDLGYNTLIAIQSSAFLMTLCRKNIITFVEHGIIYTACLVLSTAYILWIQGSVQFLALVGAMFALRITFRLNKYLLWAVFTALNSPEAAPYLHQGAVAATAGLAPALNAIATSCAASPVVTGSAIVTAAVLAAPYVLHGSSAGKALELMRGTGGGAPNLSGMAAAGS